MPDNFNILDRDGVTRTISAKDEGGGIISNRITPRVNNADVSESNPMPVELNGITIAPVTFTALNQVITFTGAPGFDGAMFIVVPSAATLSFFPEISQDGTTWYAPPWIPLSPWNNLNAGQLSAGGINANQTGFASGWFAIPPGWQGRVRVTAFTSGTAPAYLIPTINGQARFVNGYVVVSPNTSSALQIGATNAAGAPGYTTTKTPSGGSAATTNSTLVKGSAARLYAAHVTNTSAALKYVKLYNKATAPTVGTDVPVCSFAIPAGWSGNIIDSVFGIAAFPLGLGWGITNGAADNDTTPVAAGDIHLHVWYV